MEDINVKKVKSVWEKEGKKLKTPNILFAVYHRKIYYVIRDDSFIVFMIPKNCNTTYALPKKYCKIIKDSNGVKYYKMSSIENFSVVSCIGSKTPLEKLVIDNIIVNPTC